MDSSTLAVLQGYLVGSLSVPLFCGIYPISIFGWIKRVTAVERAYASCSHFNGWCEESDLPWKRCAMSLQLGWRSNAVNHPCQVLYFHVLDCTAKNPTQAQPKYMDSWNFLNHLLAGDAHPHPLPWPPGAYLRPLLRFQGPRRIHRQVHHVPRHAPQRQGRRPVDQTAQVDGVQVFICEPGDGSAPVRLS